MELASPLELRNQSVAGSAYVATLSWIELLVQHDKSDGIAFDAVEFHGCFGVFGVQYLQERLEVIRFEAYYDFVLLRYVERDRSVDRLLREQVAVRPKTVIPLLCVFDFRSRNYLGHHHLLRRVAELRNKSVVHFRGIAMTPKVWVE